MSRLGGIVAGAERRATKLEAHRKRTRQPGRGEPGFVHVEASARARAGFFSFHDLAMHPFVQLASEWSRVGSVSIHQVLPGLFAYPRGR